MTPKCRKSKGILLITIFLSLTLHPIYAQLDELSWTIGPATADIGINNAKIDLQPGYSFTGAEETRAIMENMGNPTSGTEVGLLVPDSSYSNWFVLFEWERTGFIKDDDKDNIDADAILESIIEGTEQANKQRIDAGFSPLNIIGWYKTPFYDLTTNNLTWAIEAESDGSPIINYNIRYLGRHGVMSVVLVTDPTNLRADVAEAEGLLEHFSYKSGNRYYEFVQGDKLAGYGLTALIAGGAGAAAVKLGFFAKAWKLILKGWYFLVAGFAAAVNWVKNLFKKKDSNFPRIKE